MDTPSSSFAPGRVILIGDHTDYTGGRSLGIAVQFGATATFTGSGGDVVAVSSAQYGADGAVPVPLDVSTDPDLLSVVEPDWVRPFAATIGLVRPDTGGELRIDSSIPVGSGCSSSAATLSAAALALGATGDAVTLARLCRSAEERSGSPVGILDPMIVLGARSGHAMSLDCRDLTWSHHRIPEGLGIAVVDSGVSRVLRHSPYAARVAECQAAEAEVGPLRDCTLADLPGLRDSTLRRRVRHVVTENERVVAAAAALEAGDLEALGAVLAEGQRSLSEAFESSTAEMDRLVADIVAHPGVVGARMTGAGFGGAVVVLHEAGALDGASFGAAMWPVTASAGALDQGR